MSDHLVTVETTGEQFRCPDSKNVLLGMESRGVHGIQVGCRSGGCGVCRVQVVDGTYIAKRMSKAFVTDEDLADGVVLSCRIFPSSDLVVRPCPKGSDLVPNTH